ncbi:MULTISPECIES: MFS transporter [Nostoc]|uniref:MFS transporter n=1 Tax=Nostoc paludosum FACHB-159 TaxID=2692908 RepID=A0ABR8K287_9NOSO|nr:MULTISPECIES: MFS transporter [Nostoc]MBD2678417.1 MFS transporter [Nostoc sp. FACHB-857]MBD2733536.1 MFS transporter [Nostoc paludosum FACHB-159]
MDFVPVEISTPINLEIAQITTPQTTLSSTSRIPKDAIRRSLRASTVDSVLAAVYSIGTSGILLANLLVELDASPVIFGMLSSIPMLVNLIQPLGAYWSERSSSRFQYALRTHGIARVLWLILVIAIAAASWGVLNNSQLVILTLLILLLTNLLAGLGTPSWLSWMAMIIPRRLRGRYFGIRNSAASLTNLICVPIAGLAVSHWYGGVVQGYGVILFLSMIFGIIGLGCQYFQADMNPLSQNTYVGKLPQTTEIQLDATKNESSQENQLIHTPSEQVSISIWKNSNFLRFLLYFGLWTLAFNLSAPFFNLYMLDTLDLNVSYVTIYTSLQAGANLLMLIVWGKLADKIGNRPILLFGGILVATTPLLWLGIGVNQLDIWLWLPLLHILTGGTGAAMDLCNNNIQLGIAPIKNQSIYFAIAAAVAGASGALGTTIGSFILQFTQSGGSLALFALSTVFRLTALIPLIFTQEPERG